MKNQYRNRPTASTLQHKNSQNEKKSVKVDISNTLFGPRTVTSKILFNNAPKSHRFIFHFPQYTTDHWICIVSARQNTCDLPIQRSQCCLLRVKLLCKHDISRR